MSTKSRARHHTYMRQRRQVWFAQLAIPKPIRPAYGGRAILEKSLKTDSATEARLRCSKVIGRWQQEFRQLSENHFYTPEALERVRASLPSDDPQTIILLDQMRQARMQETYNWLKEKPWREDGDVRIRQLQFDLMPDEEIAHRLSSQGLDPTPELIRTAVNVIYEADRGAEKLFDRGQPLSQVSSAEPIEALLDTFFVEKALRDRQKVFYRRVINAFTRWMVVKSLSPTIGHVTWETAGQYVTERHVPGHREAKAVNNEVSALSSYWKFLIDKKGKATFNPFEGKSIERQQVRATAIKKRKFTPEEMVMLLSGDPSRLLKDCIRLLALHGMRAEELCQLRVGDCKGDVFRVYGGDDPDKIPFWHEGKLGKNEKARRNIPIHSSVIDIIKRRKFGKKDTEFLIHELKNPKWERSQVLGRDFRKYRISIGVHQKIAGRRQSRVDLHSLRRWFIWAASEALKEGIGGYTAWTIAEVAGHDTESRLPLGMTMVHYSGSADLKSKIACIEAVKLPFAKLE